MEEIINEDILIEFNKHLEDLVVSILKNTWQKTDVFNLSIRKWKGFYEILQKIKSSWRLEEKFNIK